MPFRHARCVAPCHDEGRTHRRDLPDPEAGGSRDRRRRRSGVARVREAARAEIDVFLAAHEVSSLLHRSARPSFAPGVRWRRWNHSSRAMRSRARRRACRGRWRIPRTISCGELRAGAEIQPGRSRRRAERPPVRWAPPVAPARVHPPRSSREALSLSAAGHGAGFDGRAPWRPLWRSPRSPWVLPSIGRDGAFRITRTKLCPASLPS